jgi:hypothetical protein
MAAHDDDSTERAEGRSPGADLSAHVEAIVRAAEREARAAERAIAESRRGAEEEARRYLAAARLHVDAEAAARAARLETYGAAARRLSQELADAAAALARELRAADEPAEAELPRPPWPAVEAAANGPARSAPGAGAPTSAGWPPDGPAAGSEAPAAGDVAPEPTWTRVAPPPADEPRPAAPAPAGAHGAEPEPVAAPSPGAARLVAIEMAVGGSARADVERHLRDALGVADPEPLLDDVFGPASHAGSRLAWGEP